MTYPTQAELDELRKRTMMNQDVGEKYEDALRRI